MNAPTVRHGGGILAAALCAIAGACGDHVTSPRFPGDAISLNVGEARRVGPDVAAAMHVASRDVATEYTLVAFASSLGSVINVQVTADGVQPVAGPPTPTLVPASANRSVRLTAQSPVLDFETRLSAAETELIATRGSGARAAYRARQAQPARSMTVPAVNDEMKINASLDACGPGTPRTARVAYVSDHLVFVQDEGNPPGGFTAADYQSMADEYDTLVLPVLTDNFGTPTDIDDNGGRTIVFFSRTVNELTDAAGSSVIRSFFYVRDLVPKTACEGSNEAELIYVVAPDEGGTINGRLWPTADVRAFVATALARGGTFMRDQGQRLYVTQAPLELSWLGDAMACIAEELVFYRAASLSPRRNLTTDNLLSSDVIRAAFNKYQVANFFRLGAYLTEPEPSSPASGGTAASGPAWQFLRYLVDHSSVPERTILRSLVTSKMTGMENLAAATGLDIESAERDWAVAQYLDDTGLSVDSRFQHPSWNFRSVFVRIAPDHVFPLSTHLLASSTPLALRLERGGASYWRFAVPAGQYATIHVNATGTDVANYLSLTLVRTK